MAPSIPKTENEKRRRFVLKLLTRRLSEISGDIPTVNFYWSTRSWNKANEHTNRKAQFRIKASRVPRSWDRVPVIGVPLYCYYQEEESIPTHTCMSVMSKGAYVEKNDDHDAIARNIVRCTTESDKFRFINTLVWKTSMSMHASVICAAEQIANVIRYHNAIAIEGVFSDSYIESVVLKKLEFKYDECIGLNYCVWEVEGY